LEFSKAFRSLLVLDLVALEVQLDLWFIIALWVFSFVLSFKLSKPWKSAAKSVSGTSLISLFLVLAAWYVFGSEITINLILLLVALVVCGALYLVLRIVHVKRLFEAAVKIDFYNGGKFLAAEKIDFYNGGQFLYVGQTILPVRTVLLYTKEPESAIAPKEFERIQLLLLSMTLKHVHLFARRGGAPPGRGRYQENLHLHTARLLANEEKVPKEFGDISKPGSPPDDLNLHLVLELCTGGTDDTDKLKKKLEELLNGTPS